MFILDSLMISGIRWALQTVATAADAEMNDDGALREQLLEAELRREMGEISDDEFHRTEASLLARIREIRERREGGGGPLAFTTLTSDNATAERVQVEAAVTGDFHPLVEPVQAAAGLRRGRPARPVRPSPTAAADDPPSASAGQIGPGGPGRAKRTSARKARSVGRSGKRRP